MGNSSAPAKMFPAATPFGQTPPTPVTTETQPLALNSGTQTPAMSGYQMQTNQPITSPTTDGTDGNMSPSDAVAQVRARRASMGAGQRPMPFYG